MELPKRKSVQSKSPSCAVTPSEISSSLVNSWLHFEKLSFQVHKWRVFYTNNKFIKLTTQDPIDSDVTVLCVIFCLGGSNIKQIYEKSSMQIKRILKHLTGKYRIQCGIPQLDEKNVPWIPFYNVVRCFPDICCELYSKGFVGLPTPSNLLGKYKLMGRKRAILCVLFPMVACKKLIENQSQNILPQLLLISCYTNRIKPSQSPNILDLYNVLKKKINSFVLEEENKQHLCQKWELIDKNGEPDEMWQKTRKYCLMRLYPKYCTLHEWKLIKDCLL